MKKTPIVLAFLCIFQTLLHSQVDNPASLNKLRNHDLMEYLSSFSVPDQLPPLNRSGSATGAGEETVFFPDTVYTFRLTDTLKTIYTYDAGGKLTSLLNQLYSNHEWLTGERITLVYGNTDNPDTLFYEVWQDGTGEKEEGREVYFYDQQGSTTSSHWEELVDNEWIGSPGSRYSYTYDLNGNILTKIQERFIDEAWIPYRKYTYTYNALGLMLSSREVNYAESLVITEEIRHYSYDQHGNLLSEWHEILESSVWSKVNFKSYTYDSNGNLLTLVNKRWDEGGWEDSWKTTYYYDEDDYLTETVSEAVGWKDGLWSNTYRGTYSYDSNGNLLVWEFYVWNTDTDSWGQTETEPLKIKVNERDWWTYNSGKKIQFHWIPIEIEDVGPPRAAITYSDSEISHPDNLVITATFTKSILAEDTVKLALSGAISLNNAAMTRENDSVFTFGLQVPDTTGLVYVSLSNGGTSGIEINPVPTEGRFFIIHPELAPDHRLDSTVSYTRKMEYEYDKYGRQTKYISYFRDSIPGPWIPSRTGDYIYDLLGNRIQIDTYTWDPESNQWVDLYHSEKTFDVLGHGKELGYIRHYWDQATAQWIGSYKYEIDYDYNGTKMSMLEFRWSKTSGSWYTSYKATYTHNDLGKETSKIVSYWIDYSSQWLPGSKYVYEYDESGNWIVEIVYNWDYTLEDWVEYMKYTMDYDSKGNKILDIRTKWDKASSQWIEDYKNETSWDEYGNDTLYSQFYWDQLTEQWVGSEKSVYTYDYTYGKKDYVISPTWIVTNKILEAEEFQFEDDTWILTDVTRFYYSGTSCNFLQPETASICEGEVYSWRGRELTLAGVYYDSLQSYEGCDSIYKLNLTVHPNPESFDLVGLSQVALDQSELYSAPEIPDYTYSWELENGTILSNPANYSVNIQWGDAGTGSILCVAENQFGCRSDTMKLHVTIGTTGLTNVHNGEIHIYPNPVHDILQINSDHNNILVEVFDISGNMILKTGKLKIDMSAFSSGMYILHISDDEGVLIHRELLMKK